MDKKILVVDDYDGLYGRFWGQLGEVSQDITQFMIEPGNSEGSVTLDVAVRGPPPPGGGPHPLRPCEWAKR